MRRIGRVTASRPGPFQWDTSWRLNQQTAFNLTAAKNGPAARSQFRPDYPGRNLGIKVSNVEIRTVELTENMVRAIAKQAQAERDRRAKIIHAEAEFRAVNELLPVVNDAVMANRDRVQAIFLARRSDRFTTVRWLPAADMRPEVDITEIAVSASGSQTRLEPVSQNFKPVSDKVQENRAGKTFYPPDKGRIFRPFTGRFSVSGRPKFLPPPVTRGHVGHNFKR